MNYLPLYGRRVGLRPLGSCPPPPPLSPRNLVVLIYAAFSFYSNFPCFFYPTFLFPVQGFVFNPVLFCSVCCSVYLSFLFPYYFSPTPLISVLYAISLLMFFSSSVSALLTPIPWTSAVLQTTCSTQLKPRSLSRRRVTLIGRTQCFTRLQLWRSS